MSVREDAPDAARRGGEGEGEGRTLLAPEQIARRCGLSRRAVYDAIRRSELPATRLCNRLRVRPEDFDAWLTAGAVTPDRLQQVCVDASPLPPLAGSLRAMLNEGGEETE